MVGVAAARIANDVGIQSAVVEHDDHVVRRHGNVKLEGGHTHAERRLRDLLGHLLDGNEFSGNSPRAPRCP